MHATWKLTNEKTTIYYPATIHSRCEERAVGTFPPLRTSGIGLCVCKFCTPRGKRGDAVKAARAITNFEKSLRWGVCPHVMATSMTKMT